MYTDIWHIMLSS